ncbi:hypothetical protein [Roseomonas chloroacetimidivorans]|jgi:hypothetical protein|uniref:hypothetical protein n=1 Tax=Roseomonas chloroacetimidivorans TaxID=1766656 RepID=UPI003C78D843
MPRLLNILGFLAFVLGAVAVAVGIYILLTSVLGWNPFYRGRPLPAAMEAMLALLGGGVVLLFLGSLLARAAAKAAWHRDLQATVEH